MVSTDKPAADTRRGANWTPPADGAQCFEAALDEGSPDRFCLHCGSRIGQHYGGTEYRCEPRNDSQIVAIYDEDDEHPPVEVRRGGDLPPLGAPFLGYWSAERCGMPGYYVAERSEWGYTAERGDLHLSTCPPDRWWPLPPDGAASADVAALRAEVERLTEVERMLRRRLCIQEHVFERRTGDHTWMHEKVEEWAADEEHAMLCEPWKRAENAEAAATSLRERLARLADGWMATDAAMNWPVEEFAKQVRALSLKCLWCEQTPPPPHDCPYVTTPQQPAKGDADVR